MKMKNKKLVTKLLDKITKARDILETKDLSKIRQNSYLFQDILSNVIRQGKKYIQYNDHELDFTYEDIRYLSDEMFDAINRCQKMQFTHLDKRLRQKLPIQIEDFNKLCFAVADSLYFDKFLRPVANELSFWAITIWLWSHSEDRKTIDKVLLETLRNFL